MKSISNQLSQLFLCILSSCTPRQIHWIQSWLRALADAVPALHTLSQLKQPSTPKELEALRKFEHAQAQLGLDLKHSDGHLPTFSWNINTDGKMLKQTFSLDPDGSLRRHHGEQKVE